MTAPGLKELKKELQHLSHAELAAICLRMARYKKENKELLGFLLFDAGDVLQYAGMVKASLEADFGNLPRPAYNSIKALRKILRTLTRHARYTASKQAELEMLLWFCESYLSYADTRSSYKPLRTLFTRQLEKISKIIPKLHEDLQYDYKTEMNAITAEAAQKLSGFNAREFTL